MTRLADPDLWLADSFDTYTARPPVPDFQALDDALIHTIRHWKKVLRSEIGATAGNAEISGLFNTIIFVRVLGPEPA